MSILVQTLQHSVDIKNHTFFNPTFPLLSDPSQRLSFVSRLWRYINLFTYLLVVKICEQCSNCRGDEGFPPLQFYVPATASTLAIPGGQYLSLAF